jgi:rhamnosyltransferase
MSMRYTLCIPTMNARQQWPEFWAALQAQTVRPEEVIVLDSASTDGTAEFAASNGARVVCIEKNDFRHGGTRQLAAELAGDVDVLLYMTQDSVLAERGSIDRLLSRFDDPDVSAAYGRQLPRKGAGPIEAHARLFNYPETSAVRSLDDAPVVGFKTIFFSNAFGAYRRTTLLRVGGFPIDAHFGEDTQMVARMLLAGNKVAYAADATVIHSHAFSLAQEFHRYFEIGCMHASEPWLEPNFGGTQGEGMRFVRSELRYLAREAPHLWPIALTRTAAKYMAYRYGKTRAASAEKRTEPLASDLKKLRALNLDERLGNHTRKLAEKFDD